jgi:hypothetical protein
MSVTTRRSTVSAPSPATSGREATLDVMTGVPSVVACGIVFALTRSLEMDKSAVRSMFCHGPLGASDWQTHHPALGQ